MRIFLLRLLVGWWIVPCAWVIIFPLIYLLAGYDEAFETAMGFSYAMWNGA